jgi:hypothetical protein
LSAHNDDPLDRSMQDLGFSTETQTKVRSQLEDAGFEDTQELITLASDFVGRSEVFSGLLQADFGFNALMAHRIRAVAMNVLLSKASKSRPTTMETNLVIATSQAIEEPTNGISQRGTTVIATIGTPFDQKQEPEQAPQVEIRVKEDNAEEVPRKPTFKEVFVNDKARRRNKASKDDYGLPKDYEITYPQLAEELVSFHDFMTKPSTISQEAPIRDATAKVYVRHAKQFLGWFVNSQKGDLDPQTVSMYDIVPNKEKESANPILEFLLWLRTNRSISVSYEANLLRGLTKMLKFRFANESKADPSYGEKSFDDIPLIRELRKLHRDANKRQGVSPRSSDEERKWLTWSEYLTVIQSLKYDLLQLMEEYEASEQEQSGSSTAAVAATISPQQRKIATVFQYYLVLAFFACVPDRQRTIRELEMGRSFVKEQGLWTIKHGPDDYKTGKTYGDRPPLMLSPELVPAIDDFLERWRPYLNPKTESLFVQPRTGNPLTQDSVYQIVARNCFTYSGKKTNPHLLRDMIVTHVRDSDASEKQLEALALYMGHSIQMQRTSYDRRTLKKKVAPAVELLRSVNNQMGENQHNGEMLL